jgi:hypothetical protein
MSGSRAIGRAARLSGRQLFFAVSGLVLLSRIPFLGYGYGTQPDAWRVAETARHIASTGQYSVSRFPGYPLQELVGALIWRGGPWAFNGLTALFSAVAVGLFALSMRRLGSRNYVLGSFGLAFVPVVYVSSTMALDDLWALAFILGGLYFVLGERPVVAGIFLGLAIGCRVTSGAMVLPLAIVIWGQQRNAALGSILKFVATACLVGAAAFVPVYATYGAGFFTYYDPVGYPSLDNVVLNATQSVWGRVGLLAFLIAPVSLLLKSAAIDWSELRLRATASGQFTAWLVAIALYVVAYIKLPHQARYLIPIVPFVVLVLDRILDRRAFALVCAVFIASSFISIGRTGITAGPIFDEFSARKEQTEFIRRVISRGNNVQEKSVIVSGWWLPEIAATLEHPTAMADYVYSLDASQLSARLEEGFKVYYLPGMDEFNAQVRHVDLVEFGAKPFVDD